MLEHQQEGGPSKIAFQDRGDGGVVAAAEKVQVYQQEVELVQIDLHVVVAHFGNLVVVGVVKGGPEPAEKVAHGDVHHGVAVVGGRVDQVGRSVHCDQVITSPKVAVQ